MKAIRRSRRAQSGAVHARPRTTGSDRSPAAKRARTVREPSTCIRCGAVYLRKTWRHGSRVLLTVGRQTGWTICPACVQQLEGTHVGRVRTAGHLTPELGDAILRRIRNVDARARHTQPERRTVRVERTPEGIEVLTTSQKLAHRIGRELEKAFGGHCRYHWTGPEGTLDAVWEPPSEPVEPMSTRNARPSPRGQKVRRAGKGMKRSQAGVLAVLAAAILLVPIPGRAESARFGVGFFGGYNFYSMNDVNDDINNTNTTFGTSINNLKSGVGFGGGLRVRTSPSLVVSLDYERLTASTTGSGANGGIAYNADFDLPANAFVAGASYYFPSASKIRFGLSGGIGYYAADGTLKLHASDGINSVTLTGDASGNGVGFHGAGAFNMSLSPIVELDGMLGYRVAKTGDLEVDGTKISNYSAEWSGVMSRIGLSFYFGSGQESR